MQRVLFIFLLLAAAVHGDAFKSHKPTQELLSRNPICLTGSGRVNLSFEDATDILQRRDLLTSIQRSYAALLPEGEEPEFTITQSGPGVYRYVNHKGYQTRIEEVLVEAVSNTCVRVVLYSAGRRFFGEYQSLCEVAVVPADETHVNYSVTVYARPNSGVVRFFARVTPVEVYFRHKLKDMTGLVIDVCNHLKDNEQKTVWEREYHVIASF